MKKTVFKRKKIFNLDGIIEKILLSSFPKEVMKLFLNCFKVWPTIFDILELKVRKLEELNQEPDFVPGTNSGTKLS